MIERMVVCWNGSPASEAALEWALRRRELGGSGRLEVFDVVERALFVGDPLALERATRQEEERLAARLETLETMHPDTVSALLLGDPVEVLSEQTGPGTLVVVGTSHRAGPRVRYGWSLGARIATAARGPVAIVPGEEEDAAQQRRDIVAGVDGSAESARALVFAAAEADQLHRPLTVVHCWQEPLADEPLIVPDEEFVDSHQQAHQELLDDLVDGVRGTYPDLDVTPRLVRRHAVKGLRLASEHAFMLVVGSRRLTTWRRAWLGSVSHSMVLDLVAPTVLVGPEGAVSGAGDGSAATPG